MRGNFPAAPVSGDRQYSVNIRKKISYTMENTE
ncbi:hypothetical protein X965_16810 [Morganella sp. EGD-HP17]|nr:hypothetical protein X965_16810 [Morganella sp. EGD-HP17]